MPHDFFSQAKSYEKANDPKRPTSGVVSGIDGDRVDVLVRAGSQVLRSVKAIGTPQSLGQEVVLTWENGVPTAHVTGALGATTNLTAVLRGPEGPAGPAGATGPQGPQGDPGENNVGGNSFFIDTSYGTGSTYGVILGTINGSNITFNVSQGEFISGSLQVFRNGQLLVQGSDADWYESDPATGEFEFSVAPVTGDRLMVHYLMAGTALSNADTVDGLHAAAFALVSGVREKLTAARTYYVRTDGSDSNNGLTNTSGGAFLTIQKAIDVASSLDNGGFDITIQLADGTYTSSVNTLKSCVGSGAIIIKGNAASPANVVVTQSTDCQFTAVNVKTTYKLRDMKLTATGSGARAIWSANGSYVEIQNINFGTGFTIQHILTTDNGTIFITGNYEISGGAQYHIFVGTGFLRVQGVTVTVTGTPAFSVAFAHARRSGSTILYVGSTHSGAATGKRYDAITNAVIETGGGGANYFPGNSAGTTATGGQYS